MIEDLLPGEIMSSEAFDDSQPCALFLAEEAVISGAVEKRRREFTTARWCARDALRRLGYPLVPVVPGAKGAPVWPPGVVGSITHCAGYRAAAVARSDDITTLGIDAEPNKPLPPGILETIAVDDESRWVTDFLRRDPSARWDRLLFSAKESVYKAWFPLAPRREPRLDFTEASITFDPVGGGFLARLLVEGPRLRDGSELREFSGRWLVRGGLVITAIAVVATAPDASDDRDPPLLGDAEQGRIRL
ncbi:4'-phosphopantetheinyl transferase superfamily protein [Streptosporangium sp. NPDC005286]|uniref:4'-phosphopantetheinyl transferase family protein n=1 Tax=Streptosporangium sp. NPDC005286 TaxID=3154463 RepID=UPI0033B0D4C5